MPSGWNGTEDTIIDKVHYHTNIPASEDQPGIKLFATFLIIGTEGDNQVPT